jgi:hypothetical protein
MQSSEQPDPILPTLLWHHVLHERIGEHLFFWRLSFAQYARDSVRAGLVHAFAACEIKSVVVYEMFGVHDVLVRVWLPTGVSPEAFQDRLLSELLPHGLETCESFAVNYLVSHWAFEDEDGTVEPKNADIHRLFDHPGEIQAVDDGDASEELLARLEKGHLLSRPTYPDPELPGIKFAVVVAGDPDAPLSLRGDDGFEDEVTGVVERATTIAQRSLYAGSGFGHFIILGRAAYRRFHHIQSDLVMKLAAAPIRDRFNTTLTTHISGQRGFLVFAESLTAAQFVVKTPAGALAPSLIENVGRLEEGSTFAARFVIRSSLGSGGFGTVYRVYDDFERAERALKIFNALGDSAAQRELAVLRRVQDPHVVRMFWGDRDAATGLFYLVSEFVEGTPLEVFVRGYRGGELTDAESIEIVVQTLRGLEALDPGAARRMELLTRGTLSEAEWAEFRDPDMAPIVHRDVKPENIMLTRETDGVKVKLIDFNIASPAGERANTDKGTPGYRPPNFVPFGISWEPWVDLYAVGVVLYELLCRAPAHPYPPGAESMVDPVTYRPDLAPVLRAFLARALSLDANERFTTALDMRIALEVAWLSAQESDRSPSR